MQELPAIEAELPAREGSRGEVLPVGLRASVTEVGTLALELFARDEKHAGGAWKLEFAPNPGYLPGVVGRTVDEQHWLSRAPRAFAAAPAALGRAPAFRR